MIGEIGGNMNNRGQALIEFVLILPIFIFILFAVIDFGVIFYNKSNLENISSDIINLFKNGTSVEEIDVIYEKEEFSVSRDGDNYIFTVSVSVNLITPGLNRVLGDPYTIDVKRVVPYV